MPKRSRPLNEVDDTPISNRRQFRGELTCAMPRCTEDMIVDFPLRVCEDHVIAVLDALHLRGGPEFLPKYRAREERRRQDLADLIASRPTVEEKPGIVYYVQVGAHIKIGWTKDLEKRMRSYPPNSLLLAMHEGDRKAEAKMHRRFAADRSHGREWYVPSVSLLHHIEMVKQENGEPDKVTFGAQPVTIPRPHSNQSVAAMRSRSGASFKRSA